MPDDLAQCGCKAKVPEDLLLQSSLAADFYRQETESSQTIDSVFGTDMFQLEEVKSRTEKDPD